jgi:hypothetical protein
MSTAKTVVEIVGFVPASKTMGSVRIADDARRSLAQTLGALGAPVMTAVEAREAMAAARARLGLGDSAACSTVDAIAQVQRAGQQLAR